MERLAGVGRALGDTMATEPIRGSGAGPEGFREARRALRHLARPDGEAGTKPAAGPAPASAAYGNRPEAGDEGTAPRGKILDISFADANGGVRPQKVSEARQRIASGYYDRPEVRVRLAENLMRSFGDAG